MSLSDPTDEQVLDAMLACLHFSRPPWFDRLDEVDRVFYVRSSLRMCALTNGGAPWA